MADGKKSFVLYADYVQVFEQLTDDEAGKMVKHLFRYVNDQEPEIDDRLLKILFEPIKQQLKRDLKKWEIKREKLSEAGKASASKRQQMSTNVDKSQPSQAEPTVTVNVNATVTDNVIEKYNPNSLSPKMVEVFKTSYPYYPVDEKEDFTSCLQIAYKIAKQKGWQKDSVLNGNMPQTLEAWEKIVSFSTTDKWYATRSISDFNREFQRIVQGMVQSGKKETTKPKEQNQSSAPPLTVLKAN